MAKRSYCIDESQAAYVGGEPGTRTEASFYVFPAAADPSLWYEAAKECQAALFEGRDYCLDKLSEYDEVSFMNLHFR